MKVQPLKIRGCTLRGVDDWLVYATDALGVWHYFDTEYDITWSHFEGAELFANTLAQEAHDALFTTRNTFIVGVIMAARGDTPTRVDADLQQSTSEYFA